MAEVKWIKIVVNIFDDEKIKFIETMPNGDTIIVIWFKLLCLAGKSNSLGLLMFTNRLPYTEEMLASIFNRDIKVIQMALATFEQLEMIEIEDNRIAVTNWEKHQNIDGMEKIREQNRLRKQRQRLREKEVSLLENNKSHVTVTPQVTQSHAIEEEIELDIEIDKEKKKKETYKSIVSRYTQNSLLVSSLNDYIEMRKKIKGFTTRALELALAKLDKLANDDEEKIAIVNQTIENSWKGFFPLKGEYKTARKEITPDWMDKEEEPVIETSNDVKRRALDMQLKLGSITEEEYTAKLAELEQQQSMSLEEADNLLKEFRRK